MVREIGKLSSRKVETLKAPGRHSDGGNLYLSISDNGGKRWVFFYRFKGKRKEMGLGSASKGNVSLLDARREAGKARALVTEGVDPLDAKEARKQAERTVPTFGVFADDYISTHKSKFRNEKHVAQWEMTLKTYCKPIRPLRVNEIDTEAVLIAGTGPSRARRGD